MPICGLLISIANPKTRCFFERRSDDLKSGGQISFGKAARKAERGQSRQIEWIGEARPKILFVGVHACKSFGRARRAGTAKTSTRAKLAQICSFKTERARCAVM